MPARNCLSAWGDRKTSSPEASPPAIAKDYDLSNNPRMNAISEPLLLIVDDSRMSRMLIKAIVAEARPTWRIVEASTGDEAVRVVAEREPNFVSMDVNMPGISGLEAAGRIRLHHPAVKIALCSANIQESTREAAARAGLHFVAKPITPQSVKSAIDFFES